MMDYALYPGATFENDLLDYTVHVVVTPNATLFFLQSSPLMKGHRG